VRASLHRIVLVVGVVALAAALAPVAHAQSDRGGACSPPARWRAPRRKCDSSPRTASATRATCTRGRWRASTGGSTSARAGRWYASRTRPSTTSCGSASATSPTRYPAPPARLTRTTWTCGRRSGSTRRGPGSGGASTSRARTCRNPRARGSSSLATSPSEG
jgi:hypothetical protein